MSAHRGWIIALLGLVACASESETTTQLPPVAEAPVTGAPADDGAEQTEEPADAIKTEPGAPRLTYVSYFGRSEGFPTYQAHLVGKKAHLFPKITIENPTDKPVVVELHGALQGYTKSEAVVTSTIQPRSKREGSLDGTLDFEALAKVTAPVGATYSVKLLVDGKLVSAFTKQISVLPKNVVFLTGSDGSRSQLYKELAASALTTPRDAWQEIDRLLQSAAKYSKEGAMVGYQYQRAGTTTAQHVEGAVDQISAIYNALKARGFNYTSVASDFFATSQNIRFPAESLRAKTANCIDGALVFSSALEAIGMDPVVVYVPGHAFVGVHAGKKGTAAYDVFVLLETTVLSSKTAAEAIDIGKQRFLATASSRSVVEIRAQREAGYLPSPFPL